MPENYRFIMDYEYQENKKDIYVLAEILYIVFKIYILSLTFRKIFLSVNTSNNSEYCSSIDYQ
jgi:hypothetical protein